MIDRTHSLPVTRQCQLLDLNRSSVYYQPAGISDEDLQLMRRIDEMHLKRKRSIQDATSPTHPDLISRDCPRTGLSICAA